MYCIQCQKLYEVQRLFHSNGSIFILRIKRLDIVNLSGEGVIGWLLSLEFTSHHEIKKTHTIITFLQKKKKWNSNLLLTKNSRKWK